jgi:heterodisulfide reductase subunit A
MEALTRKAAGWPGVIHAELMEYACFPEGIAQLQNCIVEKGLNRVVVAACSNRTHDSLFQRAIRQAGLNPFFLELVNLREQCSRVHVWQPEQANHKAQELVRIAAGRAAMARPVYKQLHHAITSALVIGGGVSGLTAALAIADSGYDVHLIERTEVLGGNLQNLYTCRRVQLGDRTRLDQPRACPFAYQCHDAYGTGAS